MEEHVPRAQHRGSHARLGEIATHNPAAPSDDSRVIPRHHLSFSQTRPLERVRLTTRTSPIIDPTLQDDDDRKSGSRSRGKSAGGRAASDSGGSHHRRGAANKDSGKRAVTPGVATKDTPNKDGSASKRRKAPVSEKAGGDVKAGDVKAGAAGDDPFLFLVNGEFILGNMYGQYNLYGQLC